MNSKCQNYDVIGKRGAPKKKLLSATPKYIFEMKLKPNIKLYFIFSWYCVQLKHLLTDYSAFALFTIKNKFDMPTSVGFLNVLFRFSHLTSHAVYLQSPYR